MPDLMSDMEGWLTAQGIDLTAEQKAFIAAYQRTQRLEPGEVEHGPNPLGPRWFVPASRPRWWQRLMWWRS